MHPHPLEAGAEGRLHRGAYAVIQGAAATPLTVDLLGQLIADRTTLQAHLRGRLNGVRTTSRLPAQGQLRLLTTGAGPGVALYRRGWPIIRRGIGGWGRG